MTYMVFKGERKLSEVLERAYGGELKAADAKRAEAALLAANPQLGKLREVKPGAMLVIPALPGVTAAPRRDTRESDTPRTEELATARVTLEEYRKRLGTRLEAERELVAGVTELLKSKDVKGLAKAFPESGAYIERATAGAKALAAEADARGAFVKTLAKVRADLDELAKKLA